MTLFGERVLKSGVEYAVGRMTDWHCSSIDVVPGVEVSVDSILALSGCQPGHNLSEYSTDLIRQRLLCHPWIMQVDINRIPPHVLKIVVTERKCIGIIRDHSEIGVTADLHIVPCGGKSWINDLPWISVAANPGYSCGPLSVDDPLYPIASKLARLRTVVPNLAANIAEMYRVNEAYGAVMLNPLLSISFSSETDDVNWHALDALLRDSQFQSRLDSSSIVDLTIPGFVTLQVPRLRAEETKRS